MVQHSDQQTSHVSSKLQDLWLLSFLFGTWAIPSSLLLMGFLGS